MFHFLLHFSFWISSDTVNFSSSLSLSLLSYMFIAIQQLKIQFSLQIGLHSNIKTWTFISSLISIFFLCRHEPRNKSRNRWTFLHSTSSSNKKRQWISVELTVRWSLIGNEQSIRVETVNVRLPIDRSQTRSRCNRIVNWELNISVQRPTKQPTL